VLDANPTVGDDAFVQIPGGRVLPPLLPAAFDDCVVVAPAPGLLQATTSAASVKTRALERFAMAERPQ